jgi:hypothetical protein
MIDHPYDRSHELGHPPVQEGHWMGPLVRSVFNQSAAFQSERYCRGGACPVLFNQSVAFW